MGLPRYLSPPHIDNLFKGALSEISENFERSSLSEKDFKNYQKSLQMLKSAFARGEQFLTTLGEKWSNEYSEKISRDYDSPQIRAVPMLSFDLTESEKNVIHMGNCESQASWKTQVGHLKSYLRSNTAFSLNIKGALSYLKFIADGLEKENQSIADKLRSWVTVIEEEKDQRLNSSSKQKLSANSLFSKPKVRETLKDRVYNLMVQWDHAQIAEAIKRSLADMPVTNTKEELGIEAKSYGLVCEDVAGDGNCFFHAVFAQLPEGLMEKYNNADSIREAAVIHIVENIENYKQFIDSNGSIDEFVDKLFSSKEWADDVIIHATSRILNCNLVIVRSDHDTPNVIRQAESADNIVLGYEVGQHYQSLRRDEAIVPAQNLETIIDQTEIDNENPLNNHSENPSFS